MLGVVVGKDAHMTLSFFTTSGDGLVPADLARSLWSENQMHGVAVSGALARAAERCVIELGRGDDLRPARHTVDLFRPATMDPCRTTTRVVREGRRLCLVDATLEQDGQTVARASALFLKVGDPATSMVMNWGSNCIEYINTDITLTLARLPVGREIRSVGDRPGEPGRHRGRHGHRVRPSRTPRDHGHERDRERQTNRRLRGP